MWKLKCNSQKYSTDPKVGKKNEKNKTTKERNSEIIDINQTY